MLTSAPSPPCTYTCKHACIWQRDIFQRNIDFVHYKCDYHCHSDSVLYLAKVPGKNHHGWRVGIQKMLGSGFIWHGKLEIPWKGQASPFLSLHTLASLCFSYPSEQGCHSKRCVVPVSSKGTWVFCLRGNASAQVDSEDAVQEQKGELQWSRYTLLYFLGGKLFSLLFPCVFWNDAVTCYLV